MSDQPLNDAWGQGADGKWYPPEQLSGAAGPSPWPWLAVALGGLVSLVVLAVVGGATIGGATTDDPAEIDASALPAPSTSSELGVTTGTATSTTTSSTTVPTTVPTTTAPPPPPTTTAAPPPPPPAAAPPPPPAAAPPPPHALVAPPEASGVYYENCTAARAAGAAPVHRGQPGYASHLDRDDDGVGCE